MSPGAREATEEEEPERGGKLGRLGGEVEKGKAVEKESEVRCVPSAIGSWCPSQEDRLEQMKRWRTEEML